MPAAAGTVQAEARSCGFSHGYQGPNYLNYHLLPPGMHMSKKLRQEWASNPNFCVCLEEGKHYVRCQGYLKDKENSLKTIPSCHKLQVDSHFLAFACVSDPERKYREA